ncbi:hypothetical protein FACS1894176_10710 [Bacteroidia bacterium]|nr:hypothetical protein FACS1894176_10710 [Bacteroidia bacterium]
MEIDREADQIETHLSSYCPECGKDLSNQAEILLEERWSIDIPPIQPQLTQHRIVGKHCTCGCLAKGRAPSHVKGFVSYGSNLKAMVGYLNTEHHIPYKRLCEILKDLFNLTISEGTVHNLLQSIKSSSTAMYQQIRQRIESSPVVGADETGMNINGILHWNWSFQTDKLTYIYSDKSRGKVAIDKHFPNGLPNSYLVTDRHSSYFNMDVKGHQICIAHLLRELTCLHELEPKASWPDDMKKLLQEAIHKRKTEEWHLIDRQTIMQKFEELLFCCTKQLNEAIGILQKSLIKHRENVFRFLFNPKFQLRSIS